MRKKFGLNESLLFIRRDTCLPFSSVMLTEIKHVVTVIHAREENEAF